MSINVFKSSLVIKSQSVMVLFFTSVCELCRKSRSGNSKVGKNFRKNNASRWINAGRDWDCRSLVGGSLVRKLWNGSILLVKYSPQSIEAEIEVSWNSEGRLRILSIINRKIFTRIGLTMGKLLSVVIITMMVLLFLSILSILRFCPILKIYNFGMARDKNDILCKNRCTVVVSRLENSFRWSHNNFVLNVQIWGKISHVVYNRVYIYKWRYHKGSRSFKVVHECIALPWGNRYVSARRTSASSD